MSTENEKPQVVTKEFHAANDADFGLDEEMERPDAAALQESAAQATEEQETEQKPIPKRDEKGRFVAEGDTGAEEEQDEAEQEFVQEIVDEETGRKQVFKAKTKDELIQKLLKAQKEATKAIRDRERQIREAKIKTIAKPGPRIGEVKKPLTPEEQMEISSLMVTDPAKAKKRLLEAELGVTPEEAQQAIELAQANAFKAETPEFYPCAENAKAIGDFLKEQGLAPVKQNFAYAYQQLLKEGALITREDAEEQQSDAVEEDQSEVEEVKPRIAAKPIQTTRKTASSGVSGKRSVRVANTNPAVPSDDELDRMSDEELYDRIVALHHANKSRSR